MYIAGRISLSKNEIPSVLVVDHGNIVQQGTHAELMEQDGICKRFISERREAASWKVRG